MQTFQQIVNLFQLINRLDGAFFLLKYVLNAIKNGLKPLEQRSKMQHEKFVAIEILEIQTELTKWK